MHSNHLILSLQIKFLSSDLIVFLLKTYPNLSIYFLFLLGQLDSSLFFKVYHRFGVICDLHGYKLQEFLLTTPLKLCSGSLYIEMPSITLIYLSTTEHEIRVQCILYKYNWHILYLYINLFLFHYCNGECVYVYLIGLVKEIGDDDIVKRIAMHFFCGVFIYKYLFTWHTGGNVFSYVFSMDGCSVSCSL